MMLTLHGQHHLSVIAIVKTPNNIPHPTASCLVPLDSKGTAEMNMQNGGATRNLKILHLRSVGRIVEDLLRIISIVLRYLPAVDMTKYAYMSFRKSAATEKSPQIQHCGNCYIIFRDPLTTRACRNPRGNTFSVATRDLLLRVLSN